MSGMSAAESFPDRPLTVEAPVVAAAPRLWGVGAALLLALAVAAALLWGADLLRDTRIGSDYRPAAGVAHDGSCTRRAVLVSCSLELRAPDGAARGISVLYLSTSLPYPAGLATGIARDGTPVLKLGQDALSGRWLTLGAVIGVFALTGGCCLHSARAGARLRRALGFMRDAPLEAVEVVIRKARVAEDGAVTYRYRPHAGGPGVTATYAAGFDPLAFGLAVEASGREDDGTLSALPLALAVRAGAGAPSILLDRRLAAVDLTAAERARVLDAAFPTTAAA